MKAYNFDKEIQRRGTQSVKWDKDFYIGDTELFPLWVADMDFACSDAIITALHKRVDDQIYGYSLGFEATYRKAVCSWFRKRFDWHIPSTSIFYAGGVVPAIAYLLEILSKEGDGIVIQTPVYYPFRMKIEASNRVVVENSLINVKGLYTIDFVDLEEKLARKENKGLLLCSPHNPVGRVWTKEELLKIVAIAKRYDKWIISDEIHCDIIRQNQQHFPLLNIAKDYQNQIIACTAPSKSFNLAGLQNSNIIITNPSYQELWKSYVQERLSLSGPNSFAVCATKAAYNESEDWLNQVNTYIDSNIQYATNYIQTHLPNAIVTPCEGTYLLWVDVRNYFENEKELESKLVEHGIILDEGYLFGEAGKGFERINVACPRSLLERCLIVFDKVLQEGSEVVCSI